jgi:hypothetical protein
MLIFKEKTKNETLKDNNNVYKALTLNLELDWVGDGGVIDLDSCLPIFVLNWKPWIIQWLLHQLITLGLGFRV